MSNSDQRWSNPIDPSRSATEGLDDELEDYLNPAQRHFFETHLREWRKALSKEVEVHTRSSLAEEPINSPDPADRATQEEALVLEVKNRDRTVNLIRKIDRALQRLETDNFGYCQQCGEEIGLKRLEARPITEFCIDCKQLAENQERSMGDLF